jgi:streptogramin lyase
MELPTLATFKLGTKADWVAVTDDAVWIGSAGPNAVHQIDPVTNAVAADVALPGLPCAGLATGFGSLWVPLGATTPSLAKIDLQARQLTAVFPLPSVIAEAGLATAAGLVWLIADDAGTLVGLDPATGAIERMVRVAAGSHNVIFDGELLWITHAAGASVTAVEPVRATRVAVLETGPGPRFLAAGYGSIWCLNQGDGSLTRIDARRRLVVASIDLATPGLGGDIAASAGMIWTTVRGVPLSAVDAKLGTVQCQWSGPGGDSLGVGHGSLWLVDCPAGEVARMDLQTALSQCR